MFRLASVVDRAAREPYPAVEAFVTLTGGDRSCGVALAGAQLSSATVAHSAGLQRCLRAAATRLLAPLLHEAHMCATILRTLLPTVEPGLDEVPSMLWSDDLDASAVAFVRAAAGNIDPLVLGEPFSHNASRFYQEPAATVAMRAEHASGAVSSVRGDDRCCERRWLRSAAIGSGLSIAAYATPRCAVRLASTGEGSDIAQGYAFYTGTHDVPAAVAAPAQPHTAKPELRVFAITASDADNTLTFKQLPLGAREANLVSALLKSGERLVSASAAYTSSAGHAGAASRAGRSASPSAAAGATAAGEKVVAAQAAVAALAAAAAASAGCDPGGLGSRDDFAEHTLPLRAFPSHIAGGCIRAAADVALALFEQRQLMGRGAISSASLPAASSAASFGPGSAAGPQHAPVHVSAPGSSGYTSHKASSAGSALAADFQYSTVAVPHFGGSARDGSAVARQLHFGPDGSDGAAVIGTSREQRGRTGVTPDVDLRDLKDLIRASRAQLESLQAGGDAPSSYVSPLGVRFSQQALHEAVSSARSDASTVSGISRRSVPTLEHHDHRRAHDDARENRCEISAASVASARFSEVAGGSVSGLAGANVAAASSFSPLLPSSADSSWPGNWSIASSCLAGHEAPMRFEAPARTDAMHISPGSSSSSRVSSRVSLAEFARPPSFAYGSCSAEDAHSSGVLSEQRHAQRQAVISRVMGQSSLVLDRLDAALARHAKAAPMAAARYALSVLETES